MWPPMVLPALRVAASSTVVTSKSHAVTAGQQRCLSGSVRSMATGPTAARHRVGPPVCGRTAALAGLAHGVRQGRDPSLRRAATRLRSPRQNQAVYQGFLGSCRRGRTGELPGSASVATTTRQTSILQGGTEFRPAIAVALQKPQSTGDKSEKKPAFAGLLSGRPDLNGSCGRFTWFRQRDRVAAPPTPATTTGRWAPADPSHKRRAGHEPRVERAGDHALHRRQALERLSPAPACVRARPVRRERQPAAFSLARSRGLCRPFGVWRTCGEGRGRCGRRSR